MTTCLGAARCELYETLHKQTTANRRSGDAPSAPSRNVSAYSPLPTFQLPKGADKHYNQQFADMYFLRLAKLRKAVKAKAHEAWDDFEVGSSATQTQPGCRLTIASWEAKRRNMLIVCSMSDKGNFAGW